MVYRALGLGIVLFWLAMTALLVRGELFPNGVDQTPVPPAHVFKQMFLHEQSSDLALYRQSKWLGAFHVQPRRRPIEPADGASHSFTVNGGSTLDFLGLPNYRMIARASFDLDNAQAVRHFYVAATIREPGVKEQSLGITLEGAPPSNHYHYLIRQGDVVEKEASGTPEELLDDPSLQVLGFDPRAMMRQVFAQAAAGGMTVDAHHSSMSFNGDTIDTFQVTFHHGETLETTMQTSEQGQILSIASFAGYNFYDESLTP